jgi:hypothetical protein
VAPCYPGGFPALTIKDEKGGLVSVLVDESFEIRELQPTIAGSIVGRDWVRQFALGRIAPVTKPGDYAVFVSVGQRDGTPRLALPLAGDDGQHRYKLGEIKVVRGAY